MGKRFATGPHRLHCVLVYLRRGSDMSVNAVLGITPMQPPENSSFDITKGGAFLGSNSEKSYDLQAASVQPFPELLDRNIFCTALDGLSQPLLA